MSFTNSAARLWVLVDCNNFYASCERLFRPDLARAPIVVLSNNDGCIVSRSIEAKALGIGMVPEFFIRPLLRQHKVAVFSSNYALYGDISSRVMRSLESIAPVVEAYSIDEAFLPIAQDLDDAGAIALGKALKRRVTQWTGIPVSVGIGTTRTLAKLAAEQAKKETGVYLARADTSATAALLKKTEVGDIWGIGRKMALKLRCHGIHTAQDLREAENGLILSLVTVAGLHTALELRGIPCLGRELPVPRRTLVSSRSFGQAVSDKGALLQAASLHAVKAAERLREECLEGTAVSVHIRTSRHAERVYSAESVVALPFPSAATDIVMAAARQGIEGIFREGHRYAKVGITIFGLKEADQPSLLDLLPVPGAGAKSLDLTGAVPHTQKNRRQESKDLMAALDSINRRYGQDTLRYGACGQKTEIWHMRQQHRSPRYTTNWNELPRAR